MKIYLSGPMTGFPEYNYPAFHAAAARWREAGHSVINPAEAFNGDTTLPRWVYISHDLEQIIHNADAVAVLPGWKNSKGARLEVVVAQAVGLPIYDALYVGTKELITDKVETHIAGDDLGGPLKAPLPLTGRLIDMKPYNATTTPPYDNTTIPLTPNTTAGPVTINSVPDFEGKVDGGGVKNVMFAKDKLPVELLPPMFLEGIAKVLQHGAKKYAPNNWMRGMKFSVPFGGLLRHLLAWYRGERIDADSGLPHLFCAGCELLFLSWYTEGPNAADYADMDDRVYR